MRYFARKNLLEFFRDYFESAAKYLEYDDGYRRWSYSYFRTAEAARIFAGGLKEAGINKGDRVLLWSESRPEWLFAFWGSLLAGAVVVPVGGEASEEFVRKVEKIVRPRLLALGADVELHSQTAVPVWRLAGEEWTGPGRQIGPSEADRGDLAEIVFTSGSTGEPKGVEITHGNLLSQMEAAEPVLAPVRKYLRPLVPLRLVQLLPLSHMFAQATTLALPPLLGASVLITRRQSPAAIAALIRERHISAAVCVPRLLELLRTQVAQASPVTAGAAADRSSLARRLWRYRHAHRLFGWRFVGFLLGGAPLDPQLESFWSGLGFVVAQGYGLTETAPVVTLNDPLRPRRGSVGKPMPGVEVKIAGDGEILVRGPNVMRGYYGDAAKTAEAMENGWFHTGDLGELDAEGFLYIRGRKKEVIVTPEGLNVFPEDVERVLDKAPGVRESAVVGLPRSGDGAQEQVHAVVMPEPGADVHGAVADANRRLEAHQRVREISIWSDGPLPRTQGTGKLKRREIRDRVAAGRTGEAPRPVSAQECEADLVEQEMERRTGRKVSDETRLDELGFSSIDRVELLLEFERRCGRTIDESELAACQTAGELKAVVQRALSSEESAGAYFGKNGFPKWTRNRLSRMIRRANLALVQTPQN